MFPMPDMKTTKRLMKAPKTEIGGLSAEILAAVVAFMIGTMGPEKASEILREWAAGIMRKKLVQENIKP